MPARDIYHKAAKNAMIKDGWAITHDPFRIRLARGKNLFVDLGAERLIAAERGLEKIAVEIKSFRRSNWSICSIQSTVKKVRARTKALFSSY